MNVIGGAIVIVVCALVAGIWYGLTPTTTATDHEPAAPVQILPSVTTGVETQTSEGKLNVNRAPPAANQHHSTAQSKLTMAAQPRTSDQRPAATIEPTSPVAPAPSASSPQVGADPSRRAQEAKLQEIEIQRLGLADADRVLQAAQEHPDAQVREAAVEKLAQLEVEHEATEGIERRSGEPGQFVSAVAETLQNESNPAVLDASLDYLVEYGESDPRVRQSLDSFLQRSDLSPEALARVYELLVERYGLSQYAARAQIYASPATQSLGAEDWRQLEESLAQLEYASLPMRG